MPIGETETSVGSGGKTALSGGVALSLKALTLETAGTVNENVENEIPALPENSLDKKDKVRADYIMANIERSNTGAIDKPSKYYEDKPSIILDIDKKEFSFDRVHDLR